jgi:hypothetical protein
MRGETDDLYFMASDAAIATEYAVQNNTPKNFQSLNEVSPSEFEQENFSERNVNPEYIAKYQTQSADTADSGTIYFDEAEGQENDPNVNVYNNYYSNANSGNFNSGFGSPWGFNPMFMTGFSPFGMGYSPFGMGFHDPFMMSPFGFRPGFNLSLGFGFGSPFMMNRWMRPGFGFGGFYDPFMMGMGGFGMGGFGMGLGYGGLYPGYGFGGFGRPMYVLPGSEFNNRQIVRGARPSRGAGLATTTGVRSSSVATPNTSRAAARRDATNRTLTSTPNSRASARDFGNSENDFYNNTRSRVSTSAAPTTRNVGSPAATRTGSRVGNSSALPSYRNVAPNTRSNRSTYGTAPSSRSSSPNYRRSSPSYNRSTSPAYNNRSTPSRMSTPSRSSSPSYSAPSRSSGGGASVGGGSRSSGSSGGSRGGRGN